VVVELAADAAVREFVEMIRTRYPGSGAAGSLQRRARLSDGRGVPRESDRRTDAATAGGDTDRLLQRLLRTAPSQDRVEIAETMDISQPTFNGHLRSAQRKLCRRLFDADEV